MVWCLARRGSQRLRRDELIRSCFGVRTHLVKGACLHTHAATSATCHSLHSLHKASLALQPPECRSYARIMNNTMQHW